MVPWQRHVDRANERQISGTMAFAGGILAASSSLWYLGPLQTITISAPRLSLRLIYSGDVKHLDLSISWTISVLGMAPWRQSLCFSRAS